LKQVRVAVVDDSAFIRKALTRMLSNEVGIRVVGAADSGEELLDNLERWRPDVITLDLTMPGMGGLQTLDRIMAARPTPVIILSTHAGEDAPLTIEALHRGAVDFIDKQRYSLMDFGSLRTVLVEKIRQVSARSGRETVLPAPPPRPKPEPPRHDEHIVEVAGPRPYEVVVIGASTGGPPTIERILTAFGTAIDVPVVVAQHMPPRFTQAFAERLNAHLPLQVREVVDGEAPVGATAYIAPGGRNLRIERTADGRLVASLGSGQEEGYHQPSVDILFRSAAESTGKRTIAILLTGMGRDGAEGMLQLRRRGAHTIAQDRESCVVYGMPQAAVQGGAVLESLPADRIGARVRTLLGLDQDDRAQRT